MRFITSMLLTLAFALSSSAAFAYDTKVGGDVKIDAKTGHVLTVAAGKDAEANTNVASIAKGTKIGGDFKAKVRTGHILTVAAGKDTEANTNIGSVGQ